MAEQDFLDDVVENLDHWRRTATDVIAAIKRNAEDANRPDQMVWVVAFLRLVKHSGVGKLHDLVSVPG
jgi:hypothetical protein